MPTEQLIKQLDAPAARGGESHCLPPKSAAPGLGWLWTSVTVQLALLLLSTYVLFWSFSNWRPLKELDIPTWIAKFSSDPTRALLTSRAPILTLGTSLIAAPVWSTARPNIYQEVLTKGAGKNLPTDLIYNQGAVMSDQAFVVHQFFAGKKQSSLIVLTYSARDFMDNVVADPTTTPPAQRMINSKGTTQSFLPTKFTWESFNDCFANHVQFTNLLRRHWLTSLSMEACKASHHPLTLWDGQQSKDNINEKEMAAYAKSLQVDLDIYNKRYNPYNEHRTTTQLHYLQDLLAECQRHGVPVQMIGMPLSPANKKLLKPGIYQDLDLRIRDIAKRYNASVVDINMIPGVTFVQSDFVDSVHLSKSGTERFLPIFTESVLASASFHRAFPQIRH